MRCGRCLLVVVAIVMGVVAGGSSSAAADGTIPPAAGRIPALVQPSITYLAIDWKAQIYDSYPTVRHLIGGGAQVAEAHFQCSGFFVSPDGHVMTASHCTELDDETRAALLDWAGLWGWENNYFGSAIKSDKAAMREAEKWFKVRKPQLTATVIWSYEADGSDIRHLPARQIGNRAYLKGDVALLKINADHTIPLQLSKRSVFINQPIDSVGFPALVDNAVDADKVNPSFKDGEISSKKTIAEGLVEVYEVSSAIAGGMSGGPTVDDQGRVVGVNSFGANAATEAFNFVSPASIADELMRDKGVSEAGSADASLLHEGINALFAADRSKALKALDQVVEREPDWKVAATYRARALLLPKEKSGFPIWAIVLIALAAIALVAAGFMVWRRRGGAAGSRVAAAPRRGGTAGAADGGKTVTTDGAGDAPTIQITSGPRAGERLPILEEASLGRESADITLDDDEISRRHATLHRVGSDLAIIDEGSSNGTYVNGKRIDGKTPLSDGDTVRVGQTTFDVVLPGRRALSSEETPTLVVKSGGSSGKRFPIDRERSIGRETADIIVDDAEISRRHALLRPVEGGLEISDLQSSNGTFVNGNRINGGYRLAPGDVIRMGDTTFEVELPGRRSAETAVGGGTVIQPRD
jgi:serine protease Do